MKMLTLLGLSAAFTLASGTARAEAQGCDPAGDVQFICGQPNPEDLVSVPRSDWVLYSRYAENGAISMINAP